MDCNYIATVSRYDCEREDNIADRIRCKKKLKIENYSKRIEERTCFANYQINNLPNEILCQIFSYLNFKDRIIIERVCTQWREVGTSWSDICVLNPTMLLAVTDTDKNLKLSKLIEVLERCNISLRKLEIDFSLLCGQRFSKKICSYCPNLQSLIIRGMCVSITTEDAMVMISGWKNLTEITLSRAGISDECLWFFTAYNIEHLDLSQNSIVGTNFCLIKDCLKSLVLNGCDQITSDNMKHIANLHGIRNLQLNGCKLVNVETLISVVKSHQASLVELNLGERFYPSDGLTFSMVASYCQNVRILCLAYNTEIDDDVVSVISNTCIQLRVLNLSFTGVMNNSLRTLSVLPRLQSLCVNFNFWISTDGIRGISESQSLKRIELQHCYYIKIQDIVYLAKNCRTLKVINIRPYWTSTENLMEELLSQLPREEGYTLDVIAEEYVIFRFVCESSEMVLHQIYEL